jgi:hypothetical protein
VLRIVAMPDQKPEKLNRLYPLVASELNKHDAGGLISGPFTIPSHR